MVKNIGFKVSFTQEKRNVDLYVSDPKGMSTEYVQSRIGAFCTAFPNQSITKTITTV
jgi:hypothetical protein